MATRYYNWSIRWQSPPLVVTLAAHSFGPNFRYARLMMVRATVSTPAYLWILANYAVRVSDASIRKLLRPRSTEDLVLEPVSGRMESAIDSSYSFDGYVEVPIYRITDTTMLTPIELKRVSGADVVVAWPGAESSPPALPVLKRQAEPDLPLVKKPRVKKPVKPEPVEPESVYASSSSSGRMTDDEIASNGGSVGSSSKCKPMPIAREVWFLRGEPLGVLKLVGGRHKDIYILPYGVAQPVSACACIYDLDEFELSPSDLLNFIKTGVYYLDKVKIRLPNIYLLSRSEFKDIYSDLIGAYPRDKVSIETLVEHIKNFMEVKDSDTTFVNQGYEIKN